MITVKDVTKTYGKKDHAFLALDSINLEIKDGETVAIVGKSGSGKSTLMHAMSGLDRPEKGQILIDNEDLLKMKPKAVDKFRSQKMGFIFQAFFVQANESCYHNVSLPLEIGGVKGKERRARIEEALDLVELKEKIDQKARNLSGGQKQRLAIARAIVNRPSIIFADEPTGNLDSTTGERIQELLFRLNREKGTTLIIVTHDLDLARKCKRQVFIKDGKIASDHAERPQPPVVPQAGPPKRPLNPMPRQPGQKKVVMV